MERKIRIHVYGGNKCGYQTRAFLLAACDFFDDIDFQYKYLADIRLDGWTLAQLIEWLKQGDIYFILSHPFQGHEIMEGEMEGWDLSQMGIQLASNLTGRIGFPRNDKLKCPVFLQDKAKYIIPCEEYFNDTLIVNRTTDGQLDDSTKSKIEK